MLLIKVDSVGDRPFISRLSSVRGLAMFPSSADQALADIAADLPPDWILDTVQLDELDHYVALLRLRGPAPISEQPRRLLGRGATVAEALADAASKLRAHVS